MFKRGDWALLFDESGYKTVARVGSGEIQTVRGYVDTEQLVGAPYGVTILSSIGVRLTALPATIFDILEKFKIKAQVIYPKDAIYIIKASGIGPGSKVAEVGTGSGFLTAILAWYVRPWGVVYSFEKRLDHIKVAIRNLKMAGVEQYVELQLRDVATSGFGLRDVDAVVLDMGDPWNVVGHAVSSLKPGGRLVIFSTTVEHMQKSLSALRRPKFFDISIEEAILRKWKTSLGELRPETFDVIHTGWVISARRG
ncbi:MAG: tRNA (adenine-N1)-methyltransferase [Pyrobaculum sp.]